MQLKKQTPMTRHTFRNSKSGSEEATKEALCLRMLLLHLGFGDPEPTATYCDNKGAITMGLEAFILRTRPPCVMSTCESISANSTSRQAMLPLPFALPMTWLLTRRQRLPTNLRTHVTPHACLVINRSHPRSSRSKVW